MKKHLLRRSLLLAAAITAVALMAPSLAGAGTSTYGGPFESKEYCVGGKTVESQNHLHDFLLKIAAAHGGYWAWPNGFPFYDQTPSPWAIDAYHLRFIPVSKGACAASKSVQPPIPSRAGYCSVAGNTNPDGTAIPVGTFLNLEYHQPATDPNYEGAVPAIYVQGIGITCDPPPVGFSFDGTTFVDTLGDANGMPGAIYPYYKAA